MEDSYDELVRQSDKFKSDKEQRYKEVSKDRLLKFLQKRYKRQ